MAISPFMAAINQICEERGLARDIVVETVEAAVAAAYRKGYGHPRQIIHARLDPETSLFKITQGFEVVEEVEDANSQITLKNGKKIKKGVKIGDEIEEPLQPHSDFGRIAAQTAKQVITQRIREAERTLILNEFKKKERTLINATVQRIEGSNIILDLGKTTAIMPALEQIPTEHNYLGQRLKVYVKSVEETNRGPKILVSRSDTGLISGLFALEVPEITAGTVEIEGIAREAGNRTKIAVASNQEGLDPVGSCVGQRGTRVQSVLAEIGEEKIDIVLYANKIEKYIENALSPAKIESIKIDKKENKAQVNVAADQLSLAIGKSGQNVRLASKLAGYALDIVKKEDKAAKEIKTKKIESGDQIVTTEKMEVITKPAKEGKKRTVKS